MMTQPPRSSCPASPSTVILIFRILIIDQVKPRIQRLTIFQRLGSLSKLMHKCRTTKTQKKNSPRERIAISLIQRMTHPVSHQTEAPDVLNAQLLNVQRQWTTLCGTVFINRQRKGLIPLAVKEMSEKLKQQANILLFPEGAATNGERMLPFQT